MYFTPRPRLLLSLLTLAVLLTTAACADQSGTTDDDPADTSATAMQDDAMLDTVAVATLEPTEGNAARGTVTFTKADGGVRVVANLQGLAPGQHGFHIHENGDCSAPDASSAGGHYSPQDDPHGGPDDSAGERHMGDLGNVEVGQDSTAAYDRVDQQLVLTGADGIVGKAVIVHAGQDDLTSQPSGDAGSRIACGVIEMERSSMD